MDPAALYAPEMIAASPLGARAGKNDAGMTTARALGHAQYRAMRIRDRRLTPIGALHCLAQVLNGQARVFGRIAADAQAVPYQHGII